MVKKSYQHTLPYNIDYSKYMSTSGLSTKKWGPSGWYFLFSCILGTYPIKIDNDNKEHIIIKKHFKNMIQSLQYTMPCIFCRKSFKQFYKELPIDSFLIGRFEFAYWLYLIRDKVNQKLIKQENEHYLNEKNKLKSAYYSRKLTKKDYYNQLENIKKNIIITKKSPPFEDILQKYETIRSQCNKKIKTCS